MDVNSVDTKKHSKFVLEIEKFIKAKKKKTTQIKGNVEKIDLDNKILTVRLHQIKSTGLSINSLILIRDAGLLGKIECPLERAVVKSVYNSVIEIEIKSDPSEFENKKIVIDANQTDVILERLENIVKNINKGEISLDNARLLDVLIDKNRPRYNKKRICFFSKKHNAEQKEAITKAVEAEDFHLIIGPPGTGKTHVIEELIKQFSRRNQKLLITAWTNLTVDNIIKRLSKNELKNLLRIGPVDKIDPKVREHSIFEKMKKHKSWKEVEQHQKSIDNFSKMIKRVVIDRDLVQRNINQIMNNKKFLNEELNSLIIERQKYQVIMASVTSKNIPNICCIDNITKLNQKSEVCLKLSKNILQMKKLKLKIPEAEQIQQLEMWIKNMKFSIFGKKITSIFSKTNREKLRILKQKYKENVGYRDKALELQKEYYNLKDICEEEFNKIYLEGEGHPDMDALNMEYELYKILKSTYLPAFKNQENLKIKRRISEVDLEVYKIYLESLRLQIDLLNIKIKNLNTDIYIQINYKKDLEKQRDNFSCSLDFHKRKRDKLKKVIMSEIINKANIIAATAISSGNHLLDTLDFDVMIMDEASQVASFMSLLPILKCKKFILVGDNKQLQPIEDEDISKEMNLSIFNRLFEMYPKASTLLVIQYRMNKDIARIASEIFYEGKLRTSEEAAGRVLDFKVSKPKFLNPKVPVLFIDTSKKEYYEDEIGFGCSNTKEAKYVAHLVSLFVENGIEMDAIGVVTPYVKQKILIENFLKNIEMEDVAVGTVHKFQGQEKDIIIVSFSRSKKYSFPQYKLKFIKNETLVNVAITRAKKKLILVGNSKTLCRSRLLKKIITMIEGKDI